MENNELLNMIKFENEIIIGKLDTPLSYEKYDIFAEYSIKLKQPRSIFMIPDSKNNTMSLRILPVMIGAKKDSLLVNVRNALAVSFTIEPQLEKEYLNSISVIKQPGPAGIATLN